MSLSPCPPLPNLVPLFSHFRFGFKIDGQNGGRRSVYQKMIASTPTRGRVSHIQSMRLLQRSGMLTATARQLVGHIRLFLLIRTCPQALVQQQTAHAVTMATCNGDQSLVMGSWYVKTLTISKRIWHRREVQREL